MSIFREFFRKMSSSSQPSLAPVGVRGMKVLDREKFLRNIQVPVLYLKEENLSKIFKQCRPYILKIENFKPIMDLQANSSFNKCIYLHPEKVTQWKDIDEESRNVLQQFGVTEKNLTSKEVQLGYENWSYDTIFKAVLPEDEEVISGYSQIGHIIHLNLREHLLEYRQVIGQVLLDKIKTCRTVVNKSNIIDNTYRNFSMEVIAGKEDYLVAVKENRCKFEFDFSKVYWNPRLGKEHERILGFLKPGDVLFDVFCGVGPFSIPAAKRKCTVYANDLNPDSFKWLKHNAEINKVDKRLFQPYNLDGKDFICYVFKDHLTKLCKRNTQFSGKIHVTMNLPAMAVKFLKNFKGLLKDEELTDKFNYDIVVYVYCFAIGDDSVAEARQMVNENMKFDLSSFITDIFDVRNVSPKKEMMRVTFNLTKEILFDGHKSCAPVEPPAKKTRTTPQTTMTAL
ncbi:tRNA (guanine(37)-N1)-methyltransferase [Ostrinia nubilalis]|uniref:tRNA (guanine(37)-N1)-methyltransferase n=1 Tax=Ostrinia nubilalis TaxID=29057 RepID=UPI0030823C13